MRVGLLIRNKAGSCRDAWMGCLGQAVHHVYLGEQLVVRGNRVARYDLSHAVVVADCMGGYKNAVLLRLNLLLVNLRLLEVLLLSERIWHANWSLEVGRQRVMLWL